MCNVLGCCLSISKYICVHVYLILWYSACELPFYLIKNAYNNSICYRNVYHSTSELLTKNLESLQVVHGEGGGVGLLVKTLVHGLVDLLGDGLVAVLVHEDVVEYPEGQAKGVVVDVQVDKVVALDLILRLAARQHVLDGRLDVVGGVAPGEQLG